jgi:hypothetical protein
MRSHDIVASYVIIALMRSQVIVAFQIILAL